jgi:hypothetical protein
MDSKAKAVGKERIEAVEFGLHTAKLEKDMKHRRKGACYVTLTVLDLVSQVRDVVLMNVYLDLGNSGGRDFGMGGKWEDQFTSNLGTRWTDPITARRVPSK